MVALSCAHGAAQLTGQRAGRDRSRGMRHPGAGRRRPQRREGPHPAFIFAGLSPFTQEGELRGSRNEFIQWIQDVADQRGIVRGYMKYTNEFRTGKNMPQLVRRAMQMAHSDPKGPVYLTGAREVMEEESRADRDGSRSVGARSRPRRCPRPAWRRSPPRWRRPDGRWS